MSGTTILRPTHSPNLQLAGDEYDRLFQDNYNNALRLYFNQVDGYTSGLSDRAGGRFLAFPYGSFYDTTTQTAAVINTAYAMTLDTLVSSVDISTGTPTSRIYATYSGTYNIQFSAQFTSTSGAAQLVYVWPRINGVDVPYSATKIALQGAAPEVAAAWNFVLPMVGGDYIELMWSANDTRVKILAQAPVAPAPAIPSVIVTVTFVSRPPT